MILCREPEPGKGHKEDVYWHLPLAVRAPKSLFFTLDIKKIKSIFRNVTHSLKNIKNISGKKRLGKREGGGKG